MTPFRPPVVPLLPFRPPVVPFHPPVVPVVPFRPPIVPILPFRPPIVPVGPVPPIIGDGNGGLAESEGMPLTDQDVKEIERFIIESPEPPEL